MPYHIFAGQLAERDVIDLLQDIDCDLQTALCLKREILLREVSCHNHFGAEPDSCQEHLHLRRRGILRFIQDDKRIVQSPAAHIRQRRNLDQTLLQISGTAFRSHNLIQGIIERTKIRIHLALQIAGQKTELFTGFNRRPRQYNP